MDESTENVAGTTESSVSSGTATDAMIRAATAAEASAATPTGAESAVPVTAPTGAESVGRPAGVTPPASTEGAKGPQAPTGVVAPKPGDAPENRIQAAVRNARTETRAEVEKEYAWAKGVNPEAARTAFDITGELLKEPKAFAHRLASELGFQLVPIGQPAPPAGPKVEEVDLTPRLRSEDGQEVYTVQQAKALVEKALAEVRGEIRPLLDARQRAEKTAQEEEIRTRSKEQISSFLTQARTWKHFQTAGPDGKMIDNPAIFAKLLDMPEQERRELGPRAALHHAYNLFLEESVFPTLTQQTEAQVRSENARKAAASLTARPGSSSGDGTPTKLRDGDVDGLAAHMERMAGVTA